MLGGSFPTRSSRHRPAWLPPPPRDSRSECGNPLSSACMKPLVQMNLQLHLVVTDITGVTGMRILRDIVAGQTDPHRLAKHRDHRCQSSEAEIAAALTGNYRPEHLFALKQNLELFDAFQLQIQTCDVAIESRPAASSSTLKPEHLLATASKMAHDPSERTSVQAPASPPPDRRGRPLPDRRDRTLFRASLARRDRYRYEPMAY